MNFEDEITRAPSDELSQKTVMAATGGETLPDRDITDYEWAMQYIDSNKKVVLVTARVAKLEKNARSCMVGCYD